MRVSVEGDRILVQEHGSIWNPETGQTRFNFDVAGLANKVAPHARRVAQTALNAYEEMNAVDWYALEDGRCVEA